MRSLTRWKFFAILAAVLSVGMVACLMIRIGMAHERTEFIGKVDPKSGYRCRFTLSSDWQRNEAESRSQAALGNEFDVFHLTRNPTRLWIEDHLLRRQATNPPTIAFIAMNMIQNKLSGSYHVVEGYPELAVKGNSRTVTYRHLHVDGYAATVFTLERAVPSAPFRTSFLLVYVPERSLLYAVIGDSGTLDYAPTDREMQAVIASFHVEKVVPAGGKR